MPTLVVVPCAAKKIWDEYPDAGPTRADNVYQGAPFKVNKEYAKTFADRWVILSAKYGFVDPAFIIPENYDVTFDDAGTEPISVKELRGQVKHKRLDRFDKVVALGSHTYAGKTKAAFTGTQAKICTPAAGLGMFKMMGAVRAAIDSGRAFSC
jgi:hypothetical protein